MADVLVDSHAFVWYLLDRGRLSGPAIQVLEETVRSGASVLVSVISLIEITYLVEKGRLPSLALGRINDQLDQSDVAMTAVPIDLKVARALRRVS